jgi:hypothetical protein
MQSFTNLLIGSKKAPKVKKFQERLESSIKGFHVAFTITSKKWRNSESWPLVLRQLEDLHRSVDHYYSRLFQQLARQTLVYQSVEPVRIVAEAINCKTIEKHPTSLTVPKDMRPLNYCLLAYDNCVPIDVNEFIEGLRTPAR